MRNALIFLKDQLTGNSLITDEVPAANIYPLIAASKVPENDFIVFSCERQGRFTKDGLKDYSATVMVFKSNLLEAATVADIIEEQLTNHERIYGETSSAQYSEDFETAYINLTFTFKI
tara:strand:+ start:195 stop:548 length:354 start_codon:yes stop_codon:yes gene_type:complete